VRRACLQGELHVLEIAQTRVVRPHRHGTKGDTGQPTGFYLGEVTHPLAGLDAADVPVEFASTQGGEPPVDGLDLNDATNAHYRNDKNFRNAIRTTRRFDDIDPSRYAAILFAGDHGAMWDFPNSAIPARQPTATGRMWRTA
jgi:putative intracellular protease/amidase